MGWDVGSVGGRESVVCKVEMDIPQSPNLVEFSRDRQDQAQAQFRIGEDRSRTGAAFHFPIDALQAHATHPAKRSTNIWFGTN